MFCSIKHAHLGIAYPAKTVLDGLDGHL